MARLKDKYRAEVAPALQQRFQYKNVMEIPRLEKVVINMGLGDCKDNAKALETAVSELTTIAGQKPRGQGMPGGIIEKEAAIDASNVMVICPKCGQPTRIGPVFVEGEGKASRRKRRVCKKCKAVFDN